MQDDDVRSKVTSDFTGFIGQYSGLHDAELVELSIFADRRLVKLRFAAERYETEEWETIEVAIDGVTAFAFTAPNATPAFADYVFPTNRDVDDVALCGAGPARLVVKGIYGWRLEVTAQRFTASVLSIAGADA